MKKIFILIALLVISFSTGCKKPTEEILFISGLHEVEVGKSITLTVNTTQKVIWSVDNPDYASINQDGKLIGIAPGEVVVTVRKANKENVYSTYNVTVKAIEDEEEIKYYASKILSIDEENDTIELLNVSITKITKNTKIYQLIDNEVKTLSLKDLYIGLDNIYVAVNTKEKVIEAILVDGKIGFSNIRVAIRNDINDIANDATLYHDVILLNTSYYTTIKTFDNCQKLGFTGDQRLIILVNEGKIEVLSNNYLLLSTSKRIIISSGNPITVTSIYRSMGYPSYVDNLEVSLVNGRLLLINDVNLETYLKRVVPSEMPSSFHIEALKAQAVAARTFAYKDILNKTNAKYGYAVDDSVKSQVYNNSNPSTKTNEAVDATSGTIMTNNGEPISIYYYSSSSGLTASAHEVWINTEIGEPIPWLLGQNLAYDVNTGEQITFNYQSEASMLAFFKKIQMQTPDLNSPYHRWKISMTKEQLTNTINTNLKISYQNTPESILTYENESWVSKPIPSNIGDVTRVYVNERGASGVVVSLIIETTTGKYKIINQYNIRFTIRPKDAGSQVIRYTAKNTDTTYSNIAYNDSVLPSGFFAIAEEDGNIVFYGGGNGHGVGMSQYGAHGYGTMGYKYHQILNAYFSNIELSKITFIYNDIENYQDILEGILFGK